MSSSSRLLMYVAILVLVVGAGLWILGGKKDDFSTKIVIDAPPEHVFPYLTDPDLLTQWIEGLEYVESLVPNSDENVPSRATRTTRVIEDDGQRIEFEDEVIRFEQDRMISIQSSNPMQMVTSIFLLEPLEDATTELELRVKASHVGFGRLLAPLRDSSRQSRIKDNALRLKELVEQENNHLQPPSSIQDVSESRGEL